MSDTKATPVRMIDCPNRRLVSEASCGVCDCRIPAGAWVVPLPHVGNVCSATCLACVPDMRIGLDPAEMISRARRLEREAEYLRDEAEDLEDEAREIREAAEKIEQIPRSSAYALAAADGAKR